MASEPWHYPPSDPRIGLQVDPSLARARDLIGRAKDKARQVVALGESAERLDLGALAERGLAMLLDDVVGPAEGGAPPARCATSSAPPTRACIALAHEDMPAHRARLPGCVEGPA